MNRVKDYACFVGWFAGLGYIALWPVTSVEFDGKSAGAVAVCEAAPTALDALCRSGGALQLPPGLHAIGAVSVLFVASQLLRYAVRRSRRVRQRHSGTVNAPPAVTAPPMPARQQLVPSRQVKPRSHFGLRGVEQR